MKITVKDGIGREVNPFERDEQSQLPGKYDLFEEKVIRAPVFASDGITKLVNGFFEADLKELWQERKGDAPWQDCVIDGHDPILQTGYEHQKVYFYVTTVPSAKPVEKGCPFDEPLPALEKPVFLNREKVIEIINRTIGEFQPGLAEKLKFQINEL